MSRHQIWSEIVLVKNLFSEDNILKLSKLPNITALNLLFPFGHDRLSHYANFLLLYSVIFCKSLEWHVMP